MSLDEVTQNVHRNLTPSPSHVPERRTDTELLGGQLTDHGRGHVTRHQLADQTSIGRSRLVAGSPLCVCVCVCVFH